MSRAGGFPRSPQEPPGRNGVRQLRRLVPDHLAPSARLGSRPTAIREIFHAPSGHRRRPDRRLGRRLLRDARREHGGWSSGRGRNRRSCRRTGGGGRRRWSRRRHWLNGTGATPLPALPPLSPPSSLLQIGFRHRLEQAYSLPRVPLLRVPSPARKSVSAHAVCALNRRLRLMASDRLPARLMSAPS
jgi:hypothetical protein